MTVDKLIDSSKLDACCTAEANAIRAKTGGSSSITYDWANSKGFADAIAAISGGSDGTWEEIAAGTYSGALESDLVTYLRLRAFAECTHITSISFPNLTNSRDRAFENVPATSAYLPKLATVGPWGFAFFGAPTLDFYLPKVTSLTNGMFESFKGRKIVLPLPTSAGNIFLNSPNLEALDFGSLSSITGPNTFKNVAKLETIIFRNTSVVTLSNVSAFVGTPFASGGTGGTIYIPKTLYDALGTGTNDYKAATNWGTIDGYGTITWAKIEGSYYETHYADGTVIS